MADASTGCPADPSLVAAPSAAPTDEWALCATVAGMPRGSAVVSRAAYSEAYRLPITATPSVPPSSRVASLTAEPTPAFALGTTPMMASVAGALVRPIPVPRTIIWAAIVPYPVVADVVETHR